MKRRAIMVSHRFRNFKKVLHKIKKKEKGYKNEKQNISSLNTTPINHPAARPTGYVEEYYLANLTVFKLSLQGHAARPAWNEYLNKTFHYSYQCTFI